MKRRKLIRILLCLALLCAVLLPNLTCLAAPAEETPDVFDQMRERWKSKLTGSGMNLDQSDPAVARRLALLETETRTYLTSMVPAEDRTTCIWTDIDSGNSADITDTYKRLRSMAFAYCAPGGALEGDTTLRDAIIGAMDWMYENKYNETKDKGHTTENNWWDWEIGAPLWLNDLTVMLYDDLTEQQIQNYMGAVGYFQEPIQYGGANRMWQVDVRGLRAILIKDGSDLSTAVAGMDQLFTYVTSGDGYYQDGSCLFHDGVAYTGAYGMSQFVDMVAFAWLVQGSQWQLNADKQAMLHEWAAKIFEPVMYNGGLMNMVGGRVIARFDEQTYSGGSQLINAFVLLGQMGGGTLDYAALVKDWSETGSECFDFYENATLFSIAAARELTDGVEPWTYESSYIHFASMDKTVVQRPDWAMGISMYSSRTRNFESINNENKKGWHLSDGMVYLYDPTDPDQFDDCYWCTVNMYRLPGTTVVQNTTSASSWGGSSFVGGVDLGNGLGVSAQELKTGSLSAKKAWFVLENEVVNLGAGITSTSGKTVETVIENKKVAYDEGSKDILRFRAKLDTKSTAQAVNMSALGSSKTLEGVEYFSITGYNGGYYFPEATDLEFLAEERTGAWSDVNGYSTWADPTQYTRLYKTITLNHGVDPTDATYAYVTLPGYEKSQVDAYAADPQSVILRNDAQVQAVQNKSGTVMGAVFWNDVSDSVTLADNTVAGLSSSNRAIVMVEQNGDTVHLSVSDPTMQQTQITVQLDLGEDGYFTEVLSQSDAITVVNLNPLRLRINTANTVGATLDITLKKAAYAFSEEDLPDLRAEAVEALENYADAGDYRAEQQAELAELIAAGTAAIQNAASPYQINLALAEYEQKIDALPTDAQLTDLETDYALIFDDKDERVSYVGTTWSCWLPGGEYSSHMYDGGVHTTTGMNEESFEFTFSGTYFVLHANKQSHCGIAKVYVDDVLAADQVDFYYPSGTDWSAVVYAQYGLENGTHTVRVEATGTRNAAATIPGRADIGLDCVEIGRDVDLNATKAEAMAELGTYKSMADYRPAQQEELRAAIRAGNQAIMAARSGAEVRQALEAAKAALDAVKTDAQLAENEPEAIQKAREEAIAELEAYKNLNEYRPAQQEELLAAIAAGKAAIEAAENRAGIAAALEAAKAAMDAVKTDAQLTEEERPHDFEEWVNNTDSRIRYSGDLWTRFVWTKDPVMYQDDEQYTNDQTGDGAGQSAELTFRGTYVRWIGVKQNNAGIAQVYLDGVLEATVDLYHAEAPWPWQSVLFEKTDLPYGEHTIRIVETGEKAEGATAYHINVDAFVIGCDAEAEQARLLKEAQDHAEAELQSYKDLSAYREAQQQELQSILENAVAAIRAAENPAAVEEILENAKTEMDAVKTDAQLTEEEQTDHPASGWPVITLPVQTQPTPRFQDVQKSDWFYEAVTYVSEKQLMNGTAAGLFSPYANTTRGMIMTILARMDGVDTAGGSTWYEKGMQWAVKNHISDGTHPEMPITREQLVTMLWRFAGQPKGIGDLSVFADEAAVSTYAREAMSWAVQAGIINGANGKLNPQANASRAEVAAIFMRFCEDRRG